MPTVISGPAYVVQHNIDTDQIIPAQYLTLVPTIPDEYEKLGSYAMIGLPDALYPTRYVEEGTTKPKYPIIIGGRNFGCGSSREHAPIALGAAGCEVVVAESFARIFFRNCIATGELYPYESTGPLERKDQDRRPRRSRLRQGRTPRQRQDLHAQAAGRGQAGHRRRRHLRFRPPERPHPRPGRIRTCPHENRCCYRRCRISWQPPDRPSSRGRLSRRRRR